MTDKRGLFLQEKDESGNEEEGKISGEAADGKKEGKSEAEAEDSGKEKADDKPKRRRIKLDMHLDQVCVLLYQVYFARNVFVLLTTPFRFCYVFACHFR